MIGSIIGAIAPKLIDGVMSIFGVDSSDAREKKLEAQKLITALAMEEIKARGLQLEVNKAEAENPNRKWISWRELVGYICATALGWTYILQPFLIFLLAAAGRSLDLPSLDISQLMPILLGMLGLSVTKSYEKVQRAKLGNNVVPPYAEGVIPSSLR